MTEPTAAAVTCVHHEVVSLPKMMMSPVISSSSEPDITVMMRNVVSAALTAGDAGYHGVSASSKKRSISLDNNNISSGADDDKTNDDGPKGDIDGTYQSFTREELIRALQNRDHRLSQLENVVSAGLHSSKKRIKLSESVPSPCSTVSSNSSNSSSSSSVMAEDEPRGVIGTGPTLAVAATAKKTKKGPASTTTTKAVVVTTAPTTTTSSEAPSEAKMEHFRKLVFQGIKSQITWRPSCKNGTARFVHACMCDEPTFRAFMNLSDNKKDKTKGGKFAVDDFQNNILRNVLMVRIRYGYLSLNGDVRVTYNKNLGEMKITGSFGV